MRLTERICKSDPPTAAEKSALIAAIDAALDGLPAPQGELVALAGTAVSPNGKYLAYSTSASGSDWNEIRVRHIDSGKDSEDHIKWVKFSSTAWAHDGSGFYYSRYDEPTEATKLALEDIAALIRGRLNT